MDTIFDLLPDETGEYIGCCLMGGATYLYVEHLNSKNLEEKNRVAEVSKKLQELSKNFNESCLSQEALNFIKTQGKE